MMMRKVGGCPCYTIGFSHNEKLNGLAKSDLFSCNENYFEKYDGIFF
jgi:hypothetical protein